MPNGDGGGFGSRGEIEHTRTNVETQVRIPMMLWFRGFALRSAIIWGVVVCILLAWWMLYDGPFIRWYRYSFWNRDLAPCWLQLALRFARRVWPLIGIAEIVMFGMWTHSFLRDYIRPKIKNPNWPPPYAQADPLEAGAAGWYDWPVYDDEEPEQPVQRRVIEIQEKSNNGKTLKIAWLPDTPEMLAFAKCVLNGGDFTERDAQRCGIEVPTFRDEIRDVFIDRGWAQWKNPEHHQQGIVLLAAGRSKLRAIVEQS